MTLASGLNEPVAVLSDGPYVYWTDGGDNTVLRMPVNGGITATLATGQAYADPLAIGSGQLYWTTGWVVGMPLDGGVIATLGLGGGVVADSTTVVWASASDVGENGNGVVVALSQGGQPVTLATSQTSPNLLGIADGQVYWDSLSDHASPTAVRAPVGGGSLDAVSLGAAGTEIGPEGISGGFFYGVDTADNAATLPLGGGSLIKLGNDGDVIGMTADGDNVYWTSGSGAVKCAPLAGGSVVTLAAPPKGWGSMSVAMAVDADSVYWVAQPMDSSGNGGIGYLAKVSKL